MSLYPWRHGTAASRATQTAVSAGSQIYTEDDTGRLVVGDGATQIKNLRYAVRSDDLVFNVKDAQYGAKGDGSTDDTTAIQAAITAATAAGDNAPVYLPPGGTYMTTGITLNNYTKLQAYGATLQRITSSTSPIITVPSQASLQTPGYSCVEGVRLNGVTAASGTIGMAIGNHAAFIMRDVRATLTETGFTIVAGQFNSSYSCKAYACTVGLYMESQSGAVGGANSWSFYDFQAVGGTVGIVMIDKSIYPQTSVVFRNPTLTTNTVCAFAASGVTNVIIDVSGNELNASGASTYTYQGFTIKKSSIYLYNSTLTLTNSFIAEGAADPCIIAETGSVVSLSDISGYGSAVGALVSCDSTSSCSVNGAMAAIGRMNNVTQVNANVTTAQLAMVGPPLVVSTPFLPNDFATGQAPAFADTSGATSNTTGTDAVYGAYVSVTYAASVGSQGTNRATFSTTYAGTYACFSVQVQASVATTIQMGGYGNIGLKTYVLPAGKWVRLYWLYTPVTTGSQSFVMYPTDTAGATLKFCLFQQISASDSPNFRGLVNAMFAGGYQP